MRRLALPLLILSLMALAQNSSVFLIFGVKPNLILAGLIAWAFFAETFLEYILVAFLPISLLRFSFEGGYEPALIGLLGCAAWLLARRVPWHPIIGGGLLLVVSTLIFYLFFPAFVGTLSLEIIYNLFFVALFGGTFGACSKTSSMLKI